jgi:hypothetical protein
MSKNCAIWISRDYLNMDRKTVYVSNTIPARIRTVFPIYNIYQKLGVKNMISVV